MEDNSATSETLRQQAVIKGTDAVEVYRFDKAAKLYFEIVDGQIVQMVDLVNSKSDSPEPANLPKSCRLALVFDPRAEWKDRPTITLC